jgi:hypothetical protein
MQFDRGFLSPYFITDAEKMEAVLEWPAPEGWSGFNVSSWLAVAPTVARPV